MAFNSDDLYTSGSYLEKNPTWDNADTPWKAAMINAILKKNKIAPKTVVEIGCGAGGVLYELSILDPGIEKLEGYDISSQAILLAEQKAGTKLSFFNEDFANKENAVTADLLLCIDVAEHLDDYYGFLRRLHGRSSNTVFHIPLDLSCRSVLKPHIMLQQRKAVGHLHYFSKEIAEWALKDTGFTIVDWMYTTPAIDREYARTFKQKVKKLLRAFSFAIHKDISVKLWGGYSIMVLAK